MKALKIIGWTIAVLLALVGLLAAGAHFMSQRKYERKLEIKAAPVAYASTPDAIELSPTILNRPMSPVRRT